MTVPPSMCVCVPRPPVVSPTNGTLSPAGQPIGNCPLVTRANRRQDWAGGSCWGTETAVWALFLSLPPLLLSPCYHSLPSGRTPAKLPSPPPPSHPPPLSQQATGPVIVIWSRIRGGGGEKADQTVVTYSQPRPHQGLAHGWGHGLNTYIDANAFVCLSLKLT